MLKAVRTHIENLFRPTLLDDIAGATTPEKVKETIEKLQTIDDPNTKNANGITPLMMAAQRCDLNPHAEFVEALLQNPHTIVLEKDKNGASVLDHAVLSRNFKAIKLLLARTEFKKREITRSFFLALSQEPRNFAIIEQFLEDERTDLTQFCFCNDTKTIAYFAQQGGQTPLQALCASPQLIPDAEKILTLMLSKKVEINAADAYKKTALHYALPYPALVKILLTNVTIDLNPCAVLSYPITTCLEEGSNIKNHGQKKAEKYRESAQLLLSDPRFNPNDKFGLWSSDGLVKKACEKKADWFLKLIAHHPKMDPKAICKDMTDYYHKNDALILSMMDTTVTNDLKSLLESNVNAEFEKQLDEIFNCPAWKALLPTVQDAYYHSALVYASYLGKPALQLYFFSKVAGFDIWTKYRTENESVFPKKSFEQTYGFIPKILHGQNALTAIMLNKQLSKEQIEASIKVLVEVRHSFHSGFTINEQNELNQTPLVVAILAQNVAAIQALVQYGGSDLDYNAHYEDAHYRKITAIELAENTLLQNKDQPEKMAISHAVCAALNAGLNGLRSKAPAPLILSDGSKPTDSKSNRSSTTENHANIRMTQ